MRQGSRVVTQKPPVIVESLGLDGVSGRTLQIILKVLEDVHATVAEIPSAHEDLAQKERVPQFVIGGKV